MRPSCYCAECGTDMTDSGCLICTLCDDHICINCSLLHNPRKHHLHWDRSAEDTPATHLGASAVQAGEVAWEELPAGTEEALVLMEIERERARGKPTSPSPSFLPKEHRLYPTEQEKRELEEIKRKYGITDDAKERSG